MTGRHTFITEATITSEHMRVTRHYEYSSKNRPYSRTQVWARDFTWTATELHSDRLRELAIAHLQRMGHRTVDGAWWLMDDADDEPHWYAVLERIPDSTASWRD